MGEVNEIYQIFIWISPSACYFIEIQHWTTLTTFSSFFHVTNTNQNMSCWKWRTQQRNTNTITVFLLYDKWYNTLWHYIYKEYIELYSSLYILLEMEDTETFKVCLFVFIPWFWFFVVRFPFGDWIWRRGNSRKSTVEKPTHTHTHTRALIYICASSIQMHTDIQYYLD